MFKRIINASLSAAKAIIRQVYVKGSMSAAKAIIRQVYVKGSMSARQESTWSEWRKKQRRLAEMVRWSTKGRARYIFKADANRAIKRYLRNVRGRGRIDNRIPGHIQRNYRLAVEQLQDGGLR